MHFKIENISLCSNASEIGDGGGGAAPANVKNIAASNKINIGFGIGFDSAPFGAALTANPFPFLYAAPLGLLGGPLCNCITDELQNVLGVPQFHQSQCLRL